MVFLKSSVHFFSYIVAIVLFLLPLQTRLFIAPGMLNGMYWEYATISLYATEILAWILVIVAFVREPALRHSTFDSERFKRFALYGVLLLAVLLGISAVRSFFPLLSLYVVYRYTLCTILIYVLGRSTYDVRMAWYGLWGGGVVQAVLALWQFLTQEVIGSKWLGMARQIPSTLGVSVVETADARWLRAYGSFGWSTSLAIYAAAIIVLGFILFVKSQRRRERTVLLGGELVMAAAFFVAFARGPLIALFVSLGTVGFITLYRFVRFRTAETAQKLSRALFLGTVLVLTIGVYGIMFRPLVAARIESSARLETRSLDERAMQIRDSFSLIKKHPFSGVGPGAYTLALHATFPERSVASLQPVHNVYLLIAAELGLPFLAVCLSLSAGLLFALRRNVMIAVPFCTLLCAGLFDHWPLSLWGGLVLLSAVIGLVLKDASMRGVTE